MLQGLLSGQAQIPSGVFLAVADLAPPDAENSAGAVALRLRP